MDDFQSGFTVGFILGLVVMAFAATSLTMGVWKRDAVKQGYAHHDATTGKWQWNTEPADGKE